MPDDVWERVIAIQGEMAVRGTHRAVSIADLLVAATAERHGVTLLHYDGDFDLIASITTQASDWIVSKGTIS